MRKPLPSRSVFLTQNFVWVGLGLAVLYWLVESWMHVTFYGGSDFLENLLAPDLHELQKRLLVSLLVIAFSMYAQRSINAKWRAKTELAAREKELTLILETNPAAILLVDAESRRISWANDNALAMIGAPKENVIGQVCHKHLCPTEIGNCPILDCGQSIELAERVLLTGTGRQLPILKSVTGVEYMGRAHLLEAFFDVSDRRKLWLELQQAHAEMEQIFQTASVGMRVVDLHFSVLKVNRNYELLTGVKETYAVGKKCHEIFSGSVCHTAECPVRRILNGERVITEFQVVKKLPNGKEIVCLINATPFAGPDGEIIGVVESFRDITELLQARNAVAGERDNLQRILSHLPKGVGIINKDRILEYHNPVFRDYFGEAFGQRCHRVIYGKDQPCEPCLLEEALSTGKVQYAERTTDDGRTFEKFYTPVHDDNNRLKVVSLWRDVTEKRATMAAMLRSQQLAALGELAAGVAHEINNPINGIINYAQILINQSAEGSLVQEIAGRMIQEGDRIDRIVDGLLSFARRQKHDKSAVCIEDVLSDALALNAAQMRKENIKVKRNVPQTLPRLWAQPQEIEQVFINLISNARHALNEKYPGPHKNKVLEITAEPVISENGGLVRICFKDHGIGIPAAIMDKVMIPFFSTKDERKRTGLGLSISQSIVEEHGGRIFLESEEGQHTTVVIELPLPQLYLNLESRT